jgi:hypothetical protein
VLHVRRSPITEIHNSCNSKRCAVSDVFPHCYKSLRVVFVIIFVVIIAIVLVVVVLVVVFVVIVLVLIL